MSGFSLSPDREPSSSESAFLLTRQWRDTPAGVELVYWAKGERGPIRIQIDRQELVATANDSELLSVRRKGDVSRSCGKRNCRSDPLPIAGVPPHEVSPMRSQMERHQKLWINWRKRPTSDACSS